MRVSVTKLASSVCDVKLYAVNASVTLFSREIFPARVAKRKNRCEMILKLLFKVK